MSRRGPLLATVLLALLPAFPAPGQVTAVRLRSDNDVYRFWIPTAVRPDQEYSNGIQVELDAAGAVGWSRLARGLEPCGRAQRERCAATAFMFGQKIFTPRVDAPEPLEGERPYAGWLYAAATGSVATPRVRRSAGLEVGVTGNPSAAGWVQTRLHRVLGLWDPLGWEGQIPFEPGLLLRYDEQHLVARAQAGDASAEVMPAWGASLGNVRTEARAGIRARAGLRLPAPWTMPGPAAPEPLGVYLTGEVRGRAVAHDLFLDGPTFRSGPGVERLPFVAEWEAGLGVRLRRFTAEYRVATRSREYRTEPGRHQYATFELGLVRGF